VKEQDTGLDAVPVKFDCPASWKHMSGDERVRHCTHCNRKVYNLSDMSRFEARSLMMREERRLCVRYYLRPDGKMMTKDCGRAVRARVKFRVAMASALAVFGFVLFPVGAEGAVRNPKAMARWRARQAKLEQEEKAEEAKEAKAADTKDTKATDLAP